MASGNVSLFGHAAVNSTVAMESTVGRTTSGPLSTVSDHAGLLSTTIGETLGNLGTDGFHVVRTAVAAVTKHAVGALNLVDNDGGSGVWSTTGGSDLQILTTESEDYQDYYDEGIDPGSLAVSTHMSSASAAWWFGILVVVGILINVWAMYVTILRSKRSPTNTWMAWIIICNICLLLLQIPFIMGLAGVEWETDFGCQVTAVLGSIIFFSCILIMTFFHVFRILVLLNRVTLTETKGFVTCLACVLFSILLSVPHGTFRGLGSVASGGDNQTHNSTKHCGVLYGESGDRTLIALSLHLPEVLVYFICAITLILCTLTMRRILRHHRKTSQNARKRVNRAINIMFWSTMFFICLWFLYVIVAICEMISQTKSSTDHGVFVLKAKWPALMMGYLCFILMPVILIWYAVRWRQVWLFIRYRGRVPDHLDGQDEEQQTNTLNFGYLRLGDDEIEEIELYWQDPREDKEVQLRILTQY